MTILVTSNYKNSQVVEGDRGDLAKFVKKMQHRTRFSSPIICGRKRTEHDFPPPLYVGGKEQFFDDVPCFLCQNRSKILVVVAGLQTFFQNFNIYLREVYIQLFVFEKRMVLRILGISIPKKLKHKTVIRLCGRYFSTNEV